MRTTIKLSDVLLAAAKRRAADTGKTLSAVIEDALRQSLATRPAAARPPTQLPTYGEGGVLPGVDLDDSAALLDVLDGR